MAIAEMLAARSTLGQSVRINDSHQSITVTEEFLQELTRLTWAAKGATMPEVHPTERETCCEDVKQRLENLLAYLTAKDAQRFEAVMRETAAAYFLEARDRSPLAS
jgi:hypothetical protein